MCPFQGRLNHVSSQAEEKALFLPYFAGAHGAGLIWHISYCIYETYMIVYAKLWYLTGLANPQILALIGFQSRFLDRNQSMKFDSVRIRGLLE